MDVRAKSKPSTPLDTAPIIARSISPSLMRPPSPANGNRSLGWHGKGRMRISVWCVSPARVTGPAATRLTAAADKNDEPLGRPHSRVGGYGYLDASHQLQD